MRSIRCQRLQPALRLFRLGGLGAEAGDEGFHVRDHARLFFETCLLGGELGRARVLEGRVVAGVEREFCRLDVRDVGDAAVEEVAVVRHHQQRAAVIRQPLFEPDHGVEVEVVGRFVEQQQVGAGDQRLGEVQAHAPAAGEFAHRPFEIGVAETEAGEQRRGACPRTPAADILHAGVQFGDGFAGMCIFGCSQRTFDRAQFGVAVEHAFDGGGVQRRGFLGYRGDAPGRGNFAVAALRRQFAAQQREQA
jgi:hypothetical protein